MIQRIQSLYLLLAIMALSMLFFFPLAELALNNGTFYIFRFNGLFQQTIKGEVLSVPSMALVIIILLNILICLLAIFAFKNRQVQIRMCVFNIVFLLCSLGIIYFYIAFPFAKFQAIVNYKVFALMPLVAVVLSFMAIKAIQKDEDLIKSIDRIR
jgi:hypothetical protein